MFTDRQKILEYFCKNYLSVQLPVGITEANLASVLPPQQLNSWHAFVVNYTLVQYFFTQKVLSPKQFQFLHKSILADPYKLWLVDKNVCTPQMIWQIANKWLQQKTWNDSDLNTLKEIFAKQSQTLRPHKTTSSQKVKEKSSSSFSIGIRINEMFQHYFIEQELGRGGMGIVYKALDKKLERYIALKVINQTGDNRDLQRFIREVKSMAKVNHEGVVRLLEVGETSFPYYTMEYIDGNCLSAYVKQKSLSNEQVATIMQQIAEAVHSIHSLDIVHRDIKPANIMIDKNLQPKVMDFGLAKTEESDLSKAGELLGTPFYMSPEQVNNGNVGKKSDIYSLGATLYEILCGKPPFHAHSFVNLAHQIYNNDPIPPCKLNPYVSKELEAICLKCLQKDPNKRYKTAKQLAEDFQNFLQHGTLIAKPPTTIEKMLKWCYKNQVITICAAMAIIFSIATIFFFYQKWQSSLQIADINKSLRNINKKLEQTKLEKEQALRISQKNLVVAHTKMAEYQIKTKNFKQGLQELKHAYHFSNSVEPKQSSILKGKIHLSASYEVYPNLSKKVYNITIPSVKASISNYGQSVLWANKNGTYTQDIVKGKAASSIQLSTVTRHFYSSPTSNNIALWEKNLYQVFAPNKKKTPKLPNSQMIFKVIVDRNGQWCAIKRASDAIIVNLTSQKKQIMRSSYRNSNKARIAFSPDGKYIAGQLGGHLYVWKQHKSEFKEFVSFSTMGTTIIRSIAFSPDNKKLAYGDDIGNVYITNLFSKNTTTVKAHTGAVHSICFHPSNRIFSTASSDGKICMWNTMRTNLISQIKTNENNYQVCFSKNGKQLLTLSHDGQKSSYTTWDIEPLIVRHLSIQKSNQPVFLALQKSLPTLDSLFSNPIKVSYHGNLVAVTCSSILSFWDVKQGLNHIFSVNKSLIQRKIINDFDFSFDEKYLGLLYKGDGYSIVDIKTKQEIIRIPYNKVEKALFLADKKHIAIQKNNTMSFFNILQQKFTSQHVFSSQINCFTVNNKTSALAVSTKGKTITILQNQTNIKVLEEFEIEHNANLIAYADNGKNIGVYNYKNKVLSIYKKEKKWILRKKLFIKEEVTDIRFSPDADKISILTFSQIQIYHFKFDYIATVFSGYSKIGLACINPSWQYIALPTPNATVTLFRMPQEIDIKTKWKLLKNKGCGKK